MCHVSAEPAPACLGFWRRSVSSSCWGRAVLASSMSAQCKQAGRQGGACTALQRGCGALPPPWTHQHCSETRSAHLPPPPLRPAASVELLQPSQQGPPPACHGALQTLLPHPSPATASPVAAHESPDQPAAASWPPPGPAPASLSRSAPSGRVTAWACSSVTARFENEGAASLAPDTQHSLLSSIGYLGSPAVQLCIKAHKGSPPPGTYSGQPAESD